VLAPLAIALVWASTARAEPSAQSAAAQKLFDEARSLFDAGRYAEACDKFAASQALDPRDGTMLDLAICHAKQGRTATAWVEFSEARARAAQSGQSDRELYARQQVEELGARLSTLRLTVPEASRVPGLSIRLDGAVLDEAAWGTEVPLDPGTHAVEASAPARAIWQTAIVVAPTADKREVTVPPLGQEPTRLVAERPSPSPSPVLPLTLAGIGVAALGVGAYFGVAAIGKRHDAESLGAGGSPDAAQRTNREGVTDAWIADGLLGCGVIAVAVAATIWLVSGAASPAHDNGARASGPARARVSALPNGVVVAWP
jgi:hypothetical protein